MRRFEILMAVASLVLATSVGPALADGPGNGHAGVKVAQISFIDRALNLIQLSDGMELRAPDQRMLANLVIGQWVKVDFVSDGDRVTINSIEAAGSVETPGPVPTAVGSGISSHS